MPRGRRSSAERRRSARMSWDFTPICSGGDRGGRGLSAIREYAAQNHTNLEQTALVYVKENMEIAAAAKALFQHPNTVRYRLSKIQRIMGMEDDPLFAPMLSLTVSLSRILTEEQA